MKRISHHSLGITQGSAILFSDFEDGGPMWTGSGPRERREAVTFDERFQESPTVMVAISMWDLDRATNMRADIVAENITETGFEIVFRTWGDTRVARIRAGWTAIGPLRDDDSWEID